MVWVQLFSAILGFGKEIVKLLREKELNNKECVIALKGSTNAIRTARKSKDTSKIEASFANLGLDVKPTSDK